MSQHNWKYFSLGARVGTGSLFISCTQVVDLANGSVQAMGCA